jgi:hypothetical protein
VGSGGSDLGGSALGVSAVPRLPQRHSLEVGVKGSVPADGGMGWEMLADASVSGRNEDGTPVTLSTEGCGIGCTVIDARPGSASIEVSAEGYSSAAFRVPIVQDACGLQETLRRVVFLQRTQDAFQSGVIEQAGTMFCR